MYNVWPTKDAPVVYKFNSIWMELRQYKIVIDRQTYSLLEWLGDVGGLYDGLDIMFRFLLGPFAIFNLNSELLARVEKPIQKKISWQSCFQRIRAHRKMLAKAHSFFSSQLDLIKFIQQ